MKVTIEEKNGKTVATCAMDKEMGRVLDVAHHLSEVDRIIAYESGELDHDEIVSLFQSLIDSGLAWKLQGHYGRMASHLIGAGFCYEKGVSHK